MEIPCLVLEDARASLTNNSEGGIPYLALGFFTYHMVTYGF